jgi:hypothetical protein
MPNMDAMNWRNWGELVMKWALEPGTRPANVDELNTQMELANVGVSFPTPKFQDVAFAQAPNAKTVQIFLPTEAAIKAAKQDIADGKKYPLPEFYGRLAFGGMDANIKQPDKEEMLACRIGDYAIGQCG